MTAADKPAVRIFLSDVHLSQSNNNLAPDSPFCIFLRHLRSKPVSELFILGDLFDFWFEYRHVIFDEYFHILKLLSDLGENDIQIHLVVGNHDYWAGRFLRKTLGVQVHKGEAYLERDGLTLALMHGDGLNQRDIGFRLYRNICTRPLAIKALRILHPDVTMRLGRFFSALSRKTNSRLEKTMHRESQAIRVYARRLLHGKKADVVIAGHSHLPEFRRFEMNGHSGTYVNLGDWLKHFSYLVMRDAHFELLNYDPTQPDIFWDASCRRQLTRKA